MTEDEVLATQAEFLEKHPVGSIRYRSNRGLDRCIILGAPELHIDNSKHNKSNDTGNPYNAHQFDHDGRLCVPIAVNKGFWNGYWVPRWWWLDGIYTLDDLRETAIKNFRHNLNQARQTYINTTLALDKEKERVEGLHQ